MTNNYKQMMYSPTHTRRYQHYDTVHTFYEKCRVWGSVQPKIFWIEPGGFLFCPKNIGIHMVWLYGS